MKSKILYKAESAKALYYVVADNMTEARRLVEQHKKHPEVIVSYLAIGIVKTGRSLMLGRTENGRN